MFCTVAKLKMIECSFSPSVLPISSPPPLMGRGGKERQSFALAGGLAGHCFCSQCQCHLMSQQDAFKALLVRA